MNLSILDIGSAKDLDSLKDLIGQDVNQSLKSYLHSKRIDQYVGNFQGKVVNNNDPDKLGRCKVRVYGIFETTIPDDDLPWALPDFDFIGSKVGSFIVPPKDAIVNVYFDRGDLYLPHYTTKVVIKNSMPKQANYKEDYPDTMVFFETDQGDFFSINRKSGKVIFHHGTSKNEISMNKDGSVKGTFANKSAIIKISNVGDVTIDASSVEILSQAQVAIPNITQQAGFCALGTCLFTGAPHVSSKLEGVVPVIPT